MKLLHPVFNVVKLTAAPTDPITGRHRPQPPPPELIDGEEEYVVEEIIDSRMFRRRLQYLVKWEGYGLEANTWEDSGNVANAPEKVAKFHATHPAAPRRIRVMAFGSIPFRPVPITTSASSRCLSEGGVIVRGTLSRPASAASAVSAARLRPNPSRTRPYEDLYIPPHRRPPQLSPGSRSDPTSRPLPARPPPPARSYARALTSS